MRLSSGEPNTNAYPSEDSKINDDSTSNRILTNYDILTEEIYFHEQKPNDHHYCICFVDMIDSTKIIAKIMHSDKIRKYYSIFLNGISTIAKNFEAKVIKNVGDGLIFYFPNTSDTNNKTAFREALECFTGIIAARDLINSRLSMEHLPEVSYRLSADYGIVEVGTTIRSGTEDLFGPTVNICSKINQLAQKNGIILGGDLYQLLRQFSFEREYELKEVEAYSLGLKQHYPLYSLRRRERKIPLHGDFASSKFIRSDAEHKEFSEPHPSNLTQTSKSKHTVMIVDDEPDVLSILKLFLLEDDYVVEAFSDSFTALQSFAKSEPRHYDLIILDIRMPSMNGLQLYQRLKAIDPRIKIIFLTALEASEELVSVLDGLASIDVMKKPINKKNFLQKVRASVGQLSGARDANTV